MKNRSIWGLLLISVIAWGCGADQVVQDDPSQPVPPIETDDEQVPAQTKSAPPPVHLEWNRMDFDEDQLCFLAKNNKVGCWGTYMPINLDEELYPEGFIMSRLAGDFVEISIGPSMSCILSKSNKISCWGDAMTPPYNDFSDAPYEDEIPPPITLANMNIPEANDIAQSSSKACASTIQGEVYCWNEDNEGYNAQVETKIRGITDSAQVEIGFNHTCSRQKSGKVLCWGENEVGEIGNGSEEPTYRPTEARGIADAVDIALGFTFTCAAHKTGHISCWGDNSVGQAGTDPELEETDTSTITVPQKISSIDNAAAVSAGDGHACALLKNGKVLCWGANNSGQLGNGSFEDTFRPTPVKGLPQAKITHLNSRMESNYALTDDGNLWCWGNCLVEALDPSKRPPIDRPTKIEGLTGTALMSHPRGYCASQEEGAPKCWGNFSSTLNLTDVLPHPKTYPNPKSSIKIKQILRITTARCTLWEDGNLECVRRRKSAPWIKLGSVREVDAGLHVFCALMKNGSVSCWNRPGARPPKGLPNSKTPEKIPEISKIRDMDMSNDNICAVGRRGSVWCWGRNYKNTDNVKAGNNYLAPTKIEGIKSALSVSVGRNESCVLTKEKTVMCWKNVIGSRLSRKVRPRRPTDKGLSGITQITGGVSHVCALNKSGGVWCWGSNTRSQLLKGHEVIRSDTPVPTINLPQIVEIKAEDYSTCGRDSQGNIYCWGSDRNGQFGKLPAHINNMPIKINLMPELRE